MNTSQDILCPILCVSAAVCLKLHASFSRSLSRNAQNNFPNKPLLVSGVLPTHAYHHHLAPREHHIVCRLAYTPRIAWTVHVTRPIILSGPIHYTSFLSKKKKSYTYRSCGVLPAGREEDENCTRHVVTWTCRGPSV
jgi:hypothetical protein